MGVLRWDLWVCGSWVVVGGLACACDLACGARGAPRALLLCSYDQAQIIDSQWAVLQAVGVRAIGDWL